MYNLVFLKIPNMHGVPHIPHEAELSFKEYTNLMFHSKI